MNIKTKFKVGTKVWYMHNNVPCESVIRGLNISISRHEDPSKIFIYYDCTYNERISEEKVFATKKELLDSL